MKKYNKFIKTINSLLLLYLFIFTIYVFSSKTLINNSNIYLDKKEDFLKLMADDVVQDMKENGVFASVTLGQAVIESGWGQDRIAVDYNNYFGMKAGSNVYVNGVKTECNAANHGVTGTNSGAQNEFWSGLSVCRGASEGGSAWFRVYDSPLNSIRDHSRNFWCHSDGRYVENGVFEAEDPETQLYVIAFSGYASYANGDITTIDGLRYDQHIYQRIIKPNNFTSYDEGYKSVKPDYAYTCSDAVYQGNMPVLPDDGSLNGITDFKTTYDGELEEGFIYKNQADNALRNYIGTTKADEIEGRIDSIVTDIFGKAGTYSDGKIGSSAYIANVDYLTGSFRNPIIYFNQRDYPNYPYSSYGTISSHGCGPTSMAIVVSSFTKQSISPITTTEWACSNGYCFSNGSAHSLICGQANYYGLDCHQTTDNQEIVNSLASGNSLVVVLANEGEFTDGGHFLVLTGVDSSGNISIADPASPEKTKNTYTLDFLLDPARGNIKKFWIVSG